MKSAAQSSVRAPAHRRQQTLRNFLVDALVITATVLTSAQVAAQLSSIVPSPSLPAAAPLSALPPPPAVAKLPGTDPRQCGTSRYAALCAMGRWTQFARIDARLDAGGFRGNYMMEQYANGDTHTTYFEAAGNHKRGGEVVFVTDDAFAYRSREVFESNEEVLDRMMSAPIMAAQLVALLLEQGVLSGPGEVTRPLTISAGNPTQFIRTEAPNAAALYGPPWTVTGTVRPTAATTLAFSLRLTFRPVDPAGRVDRSRREAIALSGSASYAERPKAINESFDLSGWKLVKGGTNLSSVETLREARDAAGSR